VLKRRKLGQNMGHGNGVFERIENFSVYYGQQMQYSAQGDYNWKF